MLPLQGITGVDDFARGYDQSVNGLSSHFVWTNRSKESLALDLKHALAGVVIQRLLEKADVLVQNLAPGAAARLGLSYAALRDKHPKLIVCDISGYGEDGPYRDKKAYDLLIQSESGFLSVSGTADQPSKAGCSIADIAAGTMAYGNVFAALIERGRTGLGRHIDISMLESMVEWMARRLWHRQRTRQHDDRCLGPRAAAGAWPLDHGGQRHGSAACTAAAGPRRRAHGRHPRARPARPGQLG